MTQRIQRKRTKGWRMPEGAMYVGRPTVWGNPYIVGQGMWDYEHQRNVVVKDAQMAVILFRYYAERTLLRYPDWLDPLRGKDLACWCGLSDVCHADILLKILAEEDKP